jgi:hypothetical protein
LILLFSFNKYELEELANKIQKHMTEKDQ